MKPYQATKPHSPQRPGQSHTKIYFAYARGSLTLSFAFRSLVFRLTGSFATRASRSALDPRTDGDGVGEGGGGEGGGDKGGGGEGGGGEGQ